MKIVAHPIVVAAALGLLGPAALESAAGREQAPAVSETDWSADLPADGVGEEPLAEAPSASEQERIAQLWREACAALDNA